MKKRYKELVIESRVERVFDTLTGREIWPEVPAIQIMTDRVDLKVGDRVTVKITKISLDNGKDRK